MSVGRMVLIVAVALATTKAMAGPGDPTFEGAQEALYDNACANAAASYVSNAEKQHADQLPNWIRLCKAHPARSICKDAVDVIASVRNFKPFTCD